MWFGGDSFKIQERGEEGQGKEEGDREDQGKEEDEEEGKEHGE